MASGLSHCVTAEVNANAAVAFAFLADPIRLGHWSLGCMGVTVTETPGLFTGHSLFDGSQGWFSIEAHPDLLLIDYRVGPKDQLVHRISARVLAGAGLGLPEGQCLVSLIAWRPAAMQEARWQQLCATHAAEIWLIKAQIEAESGARA